MTNKKRKKSKKTTGISQKAPIILLQSNCNNSWPAQDLLVNAAMRMGGSAVIVSEPPKRRGNPNPRGWLTSTDGKAAIGKIDQSMALQYIGSGEGYVIAKSEGIIIISCYFSPNRAIGEFEKYWTTVTNNVDRLFKDGHTKILVAGDFNAHSHIWGCRKQDDRGCTMEATCNAMGLVCLNKGTKPTFERRGQKSIIDVTLCTEPLASKAKEWEVLPDETLSDHKYIQFKINRKIQNSVDGAKGRKWVLCKNMTGKLGSKLRKIKIGDRNGEAREVCPEATAREASKAEGLARDLTERTQRACDEVLPRAGWNRTRRQAYWWNEEAEAAWKKCNALNRRIQRERRKYGDAFPESAEKYEEIKRERHRFRKIIKKNKAEAWKQMIAKVDTDVWGKPYKLVMDRLGGKGDHGLDKKEIKEKIKELFPPGPIPDNTSQGETNEINIEEHLVGEEELRGIIRALKKNKAPGPDGIQNEILQVMGRVNIDAIKKVLDNCIREERFPREWKNSRTVLLPKGGSMGNARDMKFRPICLLDTMGKLLERVLTNRIDQFLETHKSLHEGQYGFRRGRSTIDALEEVVKYTREGMKNGGSAVAVSIDISNAFNTLNWTDIIKAVELTGMPEYLYRMIRNYLSERTGFVEAEGERIEFQMSRGVPQGSVLGPMLWNITYDQVIRAADDTGAKVVCYADDTIILAAGKEPNEAIRTVNTAIRIMAERIERIGLSIAEDKTKALIFTRARRADTRNASITVKGHQVCVERESIKYLGVLLDRKLTFGAHIGEAVQKARRITAKLARLMPNVGGPKEPRRKLLTSVSASILMYAAPIWASAMRWRVHQRTVAKLYRANALRIASAYRTAPTDVVGVISGIMPYDLTAEGRRELYHSMRERRERQGEGNVLGKHKKKVKKEYETKATEVWQGRWQEASNTGTWPRQLIGNISRWVNRRHGTIDYYTSQLLTGHGNFNAYLKRHKRRNMGTCNYCGEASDTAEHTFFECRGWDRIKGSKWTTREGETLTKEGLVTEILASKEKWADIMSVVRDILSTKEEDDRRAGY